MKDPSLSVELREWVIAHLRFDGAWYVFPDGARFEDVRDAVQAAWLADDQRLALELAQRYEIDNVLCLCCTQARSSWTRLCSNRCHLEMLAAQRQSGKVLT